MFFLNIFLKYTYFCTLLNNEVALKFSGNCKVYHNQCLMHFYSFLRLDRSETPNPSGTQESHSEFYKQLS